MAESFYAKFLENISDRIRNLGGSKEGRGRRSAEAVDFDEEEQEAPAPRARPQRTKGFVIGNTTVDLTPEAYKDAVRSRELKKRWVFVNGGVLAACVLAASIIYVGSLPARSELDSQIASNMQLQAALGQYQDVNQAVDQMGEIEDKLNLAAGNEIDWTTLISSIEATLPAGTSVKSIGISATGADDKGAGILLSFSANSPLGYADTLNAVQSAQGVSNVQIGGMTSTGEAYEFSATMDYDTSIRTNRYSTADNNGGN